MAAQPISLHYMEPNISTLSAIDRAYAAIEMRRTRFDTSNPTVLPSHREYLTEVIALIEQGIYWRVSGMQALERGDFDSLQWARTGERLLQGFRGLRVPAGMEKHQSLVQQAISELTNFFSEYSPAQQTNKRQSLDQNDNLRRASAAMREAYGTLLSAHAYADLEVQGAFYDSHLALDPL